MGQKILASRLASVKESATLALNARVKQMAKDGQTVYNLTAGELATDTPEFIQKAVAQKLSHNKYTAAAGLDELRELIAEQARSFYGADWITKDNVVATSGTKPAIYASLLSLINPGDEVIVPVPGWTTTYLPLIELAGGIPVTVSLNDEFDLDPLAIEAKLSSKTKAIILNSPNNPTGAVFSAASLKKLGAILKNRGVTVLADDIYCRLIYDASYRPVPTFDFDSLVIINGLSKSQALTGWRIGYLIAEQSLAKAATSLLSHITGNAPLPSQYAAIEAMKRGDKPPESTLKDLKEKRQLVIKRLESIGFSFHPPEGAFYIMLSLRNITNKSSAEWCESLLKATGVALVPGEAFSAPGFARLTFVSDKQTLLAALDQIEKFVKGDK